VLSLPRASDCNKNLGIVRLSIIIRKIKSALVQALRLCTGRTARRGVKVKVKVKVKCTLVQVLRFCTGRTVHRVSKGIAILFHDHGTRRGEGTESRPGCSLPPKKTRYPLYRVRQKNPTIFKLK